MPKKTDLGKAKGYAYRLIALRPRSEKEIRLKLREQGYEKPVIEDALNFFKEKGLIDDLEFAEAWVDSRMRLRPKGDIVLKYELKHKGVSEDIIKKVLKSTRMTFSEGEQVKGIISDLKDKNKSLAPLKLKKKIYDYLARRGFGYDVIQDKIDEMVG